MRALTDSLNQSDAMKTSRQTTRRAYAFALGVYAVVAALAIPSIARAEPPFPAALQEAASLECAPQCTLCHTDPNGGANFTRKTAVGILTTGKIKKGSGAADIKAAYADLEAKAKAGTDPTAVLVVSSLQMGVDPETREKLCQITYGCGAHVAKTTPRDDWSGLLFVAGAMVFGAILRRGKARSATR